jgi:hypothetical protein
MFRVATATVTGVRLNRPGMQLLDVMLHHSGITEQAIAYTNGGEMYAAGDEVLVNTTAVRLGLGTGGCHFVLAKHSAQGESDLYPTQWGHMMKLRYSPCQLAVDAAEEQGSPYHQLFQEETLSLEQTPVLIGELHSLLPAAAAAVKDRSPQSRLAYVMPDGASLPIALSRQVHHLKELGVLSATVTTGHAWGGDIETVTLHNGLLAAKHVARADIILCFLGPGVAGTGTPYGFSGMQLAEVVHAVSILGGVPIFVPRLSFTDPRERHRGISHHSRTVLNRFALRPVLLTIPRFGDERDLLLASQEAEDRYREKHVVVEQRAPGTDCLEKWEATYGLSLTTMGRHWREDPSPFQTAALAGQMAGRCRQWLAERERLSDVSSLCDGQDILAALSPFLTNGEG